MATMIKGMRRDQLKRLAAKGRLAMVESYHFDDQYGESRGNVELPVRIKADPADWKDGWCNLAGHEFTSNCGRAWVNADGTVTLYVHSNRSLTFRVLAEGEAQPEPIPQDDPRRAGGR